MVKQKPNPEPFTRAWDEELSREVGSLLQKLRARARLSMVDETPPLDEQEAQEQLPHSYENLQQLDEPWEEHPNSAPILFVNAFIEEPS